MGRLGLAFVVVVSCAACIPYQPGQGLDDHARCLRECPEPRSRVKAAQSVGDHVHLWFKGPFFRPGGPELARDRARLKDEVVPALIVALDDEDREVRGAAVRALAEIALYDTTLVEQAIPALADQVDDPDPSVRDEAVYALGFLKPHLHEYAAILHEPLARAARMPSEDDYVPGRPAELLACLGSVAGPDLVAGVGRTTDLERGRYACSLVESAKHSRNREDEGGVEVATNAITTLLVSPDVETRKAVLAGLGSWPDRGRNAWPAFPPALLDRVVDALTDPDPDVRGDAAGAIETQMQVVPEAVPHLHAVVRDAAVSEYGRGAALKALVQFAPDDPATWVLVRKTAADESLSESSRLRWNAQEALDGRDERAENARLPGR